MPPTDPHVPGPAGPHPGAGPQWPADARNLDAPDDSAGGGGINPAALKAGHEPDVFAVKPIFGIPAAVIVAFVVCFGVTTALFFTVFRRGDADPLAHPEAITRNAANLNERLSRIDRAGEHPGEKPEVDQPRLEPLRKLENNGQTFSQVPQPKGNSPWLHPEDIHPSRVEGLQKSEYVTADKKFARIPIEDAIALATTKGNGTLPSRATPKLPTPSFDKPTAANAGRGVPPVTPAEKK